jgi:hypothetical protein
MTRVGNVIEIAVVALALLVAAAGCSTRAVLASPAGARQLQPVAPGQNEPEDRKIVRNAALHLLTPSEDDFPAIIESARKLCLDAKGYVSEESSTSITLRIPNQRLDDTLTALSMMGTVAAKNVTGRDVTTEYTDLDIRIDNARNLERRLEDILKKAGTVAEVLEVERELSRVTLALEQLEGQKRMLNNQITFASLTLKLGKAFAQPVSRTRKGPLGWAFYEMYRGVRWLFVRG